MSYDTYHKRRVGKHLLKPETQMMGYGYDPSLSEGALKPPIFLTSTFAFKSAQDGKDFFDFSSGANSRPARLPGSSTHASTIRTSRSSRTAWRCGRTVRSPPSSRAAWRQFRRRCGRTSARVTYCS